MKDLNTKFGSLISFLHNLYRKHKNYYLIDVFCRRTEMSLFIEHRKQSDTANKVADIMKEEYRWDESKKEQEIKDYIEHIEKKIDSIPNIPLSS